MASQLRLLQRKRGIEITLHIKEEHLDLLEFHLLKGLVNKYSDCINTPIQMKKLNMIKMVKKLSKMSMRQ